MRKAQFFSAESIINIVLFTAIFSFLIFAINNKTKQFIESTETDYLIVKSNNVINLLTQTPGYPINWNKSNFTDLGLSNYYKIINPEKLSNFIYLLNNNNSLVLESFSIENNALYFSIEYLNGSTIASYKPSKDYKNVLITKRKVLYNNLPAIIKVGVMN